MNKEIFETAAEMGGLLKKRQWKLALAESCTGGAIADAVTDVPGASEYFDCGVVVYSHSSKIELLGVRQETLKKFGAVSEAVAREMVEGLLQKNRVHVALAVTGIAGPSGGTKEKPVGTVYMALAIAKKSEVKHFCFQSDRRQFKQKVTATSLEWLCRELL